MNARELIGLLRSPKVAVLGLLILLIFGGTIVSMRRSNTTKMTDKTNVNQDAKLDSKASKTSLASYKTEVAPARPFEEKTVAANGTIKADHKREVILPIGLYDSNPGKTARLGPVFAPFGRLVKCELVITVDSSSLETPIIGLVLEDVWHNGQVVIPAGTEIHGQAQKTRVRDRLGSGNAWIFVWTDGTGRELPASGVALDYAPDPNGGWEITDGSAGIRGQVMRTDELTELKLFAATAAAGIGKGFQDTTTTVTGSGAVVSQTTGNLRNALSSGGQAAMDMYVERLLKTIEADGEFVRVTAGTPFYVYVTQVMDQSVATAAGSALDPERLPNAENNMPKRREP